MLESKYLKDNIQNIQRLMAIPSLKAFETRSLSKILRLSKIREYEDGEIIIKEGDIDPWLYFLLSGQVRIQKGGEEITCISTTGEIFGEMRIVDDKARSASVVADGKTICLAVNTTAQQRLMSHGKGEKEDAVEFVLLLYKIFAEYMSARLRLTNDELIKEKKKVRQLKEKVK
jgi:CRP-like cAMP-binding protein